MKRVFLIGVAAAALSAAPAWVEACQGYGGGYAAGAPAYDVYAPGYAYYRESVYRYGGGGYYATPAYYGPAASYRVNANYHRHAYGPGHRYYRGQRYHGGGHHGGSRHGVRGHRGGHH